MKHQGTDENNPINLDFDDSTHLIKAVSEIQDESEPKVPRIYNEVNDGARFRTMQYKTRFRQTPTRTSFCYKKYYEEQKRQEQATKVSIVVLDD